MTRVRTCHAFIVLCLSVQHGVMVVQIEANGTHVATHGTPTAVAPHVVARHTTNTSLSHPVEPRPGTVHPPRGDTNGTVHPPPGHTSGATRHTRDTQGLVYTPSPPVHPGMPPPSALEIGRTPPNDTLPPGPPNATTTPASRPPDAPAPAPMTPVPNLVLLPPPTPVPPAPVAPVPPVPDLVLLAPPTPGPPAPPANNMTLPAPLESGPTSTTPSPPTPPVLEPPASSSPLPSHERPPPSEIQQEERTEPDQADPTMDNLTLAPILSDDIETEPRVPHHERTYPRNNVSTSSSSPADAISGWTLALIITGTVVAVLVSIFFVHRRHVRLTTAQTRRRGTLEQRALDSLFRQNRVTVPGTSQTSSSDQFVTEPLTPCEDIVVVATSFDEQAQASTRTDGFAASGAQALLHRDGTHARRPTAVRTSIHTPTDSYNENRYDSFRGVAPSSLLSSKLDSESVQSSSSARSSVLSIGSIGPASLRPSAQPSFLSHAKRQSSMKESAMGLSRSSGGYSVLDASVRSELDRTSADVRPNASGMTLPRSSQTSTGYGDKSFSSRLSDAMSDFNAEESYADSFIDIERHFGRDTDDSLYDVNKISDV